MRALRWTTRGGARVQAPAASGWGFGPGTGGVARCGDGIPARSAGIADTLIVRALLGALAAGAVAIAGRRAGSLSSGGHWAAFLLGTAVVAADWGWGALLVGYFVSSSALTRFGHARKASRTESMLPVQSERTARQVIANGGVFAVLIVLGEAVGDSRVVVAGVGALAAATADTWATEIGTLWGGAPRSILTGRTVEVGESGGVTVVGVAASVVAAALVAAAAHSGYVVSGRAYLSPAIAVLVGGIGGSLGDSVIGSTLQSKRWCEQCRSWTERRVHTCHYRTQHARGLRWMTNDTVNLLATVIGAAIAFFFTVASSPG